MLTTHTRCPHPAASCAWARAAQGCRTSRVSRRLGLGTSSTRENKQARHLDLSAVAQRSDAPGLEHCPNSEHGPLRGLRPFAWPETQMRPGFPHRREPFLKWRGGCAKSCVESAAEPRLQQAVLSMSHHSSALRPACQGPGGSGGPSCCFP